MEYCKGGSLGTYVHNSSALNEDTVRDVAACCLLSLSYLHKMNTIHRVAISLLFDV